ncbi:hypothetical protein SAMN06893096_102207 [Geodermatophilus pulveris]|uniref:Uncharacterized protein n=1 Tax=Geodermatophilus pulveris TaxID=1564159 RepID=A0A239C3T1_9ACTN|nr:hypothetical protein [Geodermatophilus pulveris]SNS14328.1 hypothetical protein SAMN06893096_102207 [Geodermatophilus pulveris]
MNIRVHVEQLVLDSRWRGIDRRLLARAVEEELTRLLLHRGVGPGLVAAGGAAELRGADVRSPDEQPSILGAQIATALHAGLSAPGGGTA